MGIVIYFPLHGRASTTSRAARAVKASAVRRDDAAVSVERTAAHHSAGMLSRCHHLDTADAPAPISAAMASREVQSSMMVRKDDKSLMSPKIGQSVLKIKAKMSLDGNRSLGHTVRMSDRESEALFKQEFIGRVKAARIAVGWKQWQMAEALHMPQDKYKQYESRSLLPHHLVGRFCLITHVDPTWLMTGRGDKHLQPLRTVPSEPIRAPVVKPKPKRKENAA